MMLIFGTCFQLIVFAGYNGLTSTLKDALSLFDPELKITSKTSPFFRIDSTKLSKIISLEEFDIMSKVIEGDVGLKYRNVQMVSKFIGVDDNFKHLNRVDTALIQGSYQLYDASRDFCLVGLSLKSRLNIVTNTSNPYQAISLFHPNRNKRIGRSQSSFNKGIVYPKGVYAIEPRLDNSMLVPYHLAEKLTDHQGDYSSLHLKSNNQKINTLQTKIKQILGDEFDVKDRTQQRSSLFKALKTEELIVTIILIFLLLLCSLSVYLSILMTVISKKKDFALFLSWGASRQQIKKIILTQAFQLALRGVLIGLCLGVAIIWAQQEYAILTIDEFGNPFPVKSELFDYLFAIFTTLTISILMAIYPAYKAAKIPLSKTL